MTARIPTALLAAGLAAALLTGCGSSGAASTGPSSPSVGSSGPSSNPSTDAPGTGDAIAGSDTPTDTAPVTGTPVQSTSPAASDTVTPAAPASFTGFVGTWSGHGQLLVVSASGRVTITFRTYVTCTATITTGCDRIDGDGIFDGGKVVGHIDQVDNATTVHVAVDSTSAPKDFPDRPFTLGHDLGHHAVATRDGGFAGVPFCGDGAPAGYCGA